MDTHTSCPLKDEVNSQFGHYGHDDLILVHFHFSSFHIHVKNFPPSQTETLTSEKEDLLAGLETMRNTVRQLEAQNQDLQKQSASLDKDLLTERAMKEQKMKVDAETHA